ncbi:DUF4249 domain-containing protein [uncultured Parabacteroides sp.]|uniref:DUF4249 domain-containing protein n=1 Tax=uncultured Parabacteroides sp. TaxID=512312 RepID=UPI0028042479|nr:DUF4249 domain-containing protein [uncultured Parabacteroides sp.]
MKKNLSILFMLTSMLFPACENELPYMNKPQAPQLLMNAFLEAGKEENGVSLCMIDADEQQTDYVSNGSITVYVNGEKTETAQVEKIYGSFNAPNCTLKTLFRPGDHIRFEATAEDGQYQAGCEVEIPLPIEETIRVDTLRTQLKGNSSMMDCMQYKITIHDRPNEKNYYRLIIEENTYRISSEDGIEYGPFSSYPEIINQEDIVLTDGHLTTTDDDKFGILDLTVRNLSNVFTDGRFENGSYTLKVYTSIPYISESNRKDHFYLDVTVRLLSISQSYYRYLRAMNCLNSEDYNETFMEPVIVPQNVSGGLGFIGASSEQRVTLRMIDRPPFSIE